MQLLNLEFSPLRVELIGFQEAAVSKCSCSCDHRECKGALFKNRPADSAQTDKPKKKVKYFDVWCTSDHAGRPRCTVSH